MVLRRHSDGQGEEEAGGSYLFQSKNYNLIQTIVRLKKQETLVLLLR